MSQDRIAPVPEWYRTYDAASAGWLTHVHIPLHELLNFLRVVGPELSACTLVTVELTCERGQRALCLGFLNRFPTGARGERVDVRSYAGYKIGSCFRSTKHPYFFVSASRSLRDATDAYSRRQIIDFLCALTCSGLRLWGPLERTWAEQEFGTLEFEELIVRAYEPAQDLLLATTFGGKLLIQESAVLAMSIVSLGRASSWNELNLETGVIVRQLGRPVRNDDDQILVPVQTSQGNGLMSIDCTRGRATIQLIALPNGDADQFVLTSNLFPGAREPSLVIVDPHGISFQPIVELPEYALYAMQLLKESIVTP